MFDRVKELYKAGVAHAFIMHMNVHDYYDSGTAIPLMHWISDALSLSIDLVVKFDRAGGIQFPSKTFERTARNILPAPAQNPLAQLAGANASSDWPRSPGPALNLISDLLRSDTRTGVLLPHLDLLCPAADKAVMSEQDRNILAILRSWGQDPQIANAGHIIIASASNLGDVHPDLRAASARWEAVEVPLPSLEKRLEFAEKLKFENPRQVAVMTAGLSLIQIEDIALFARSNGFSPEIIRERKRGIIRSEFGDVLETVDANVTFADIGGLKHIKEFFAKRVIRPLRQGSPKCPMGVLMTGPAGTGKSLMAQAVAGEAGVNFVNLRIGGNIASKWQGEGERNLEKALRAIESLAPTIVFIDEIDQAISRNATNQQDARIFQRLLDFMGDTTHRGRVVFLAATNRPDMLDAALRRPGRFDRKIPFLVPDHNERILIINVFARKIWRKSLPSTSRSWPDIVRATQGWTGAELEALVLKADELIEDGVVPDYMGAILLATQRLTPSTADIEFMSNLALAECNDRDLLPPAYQDFSREEVEQAIQSTRGAREL